MRTLELIVRALPLVLPLALISPLAASQPAQAEEVQAKDGDEKTYDWGAKVQIELLMEDGQEVSHSGEMLTLGPEWPFEFEGADHHHTIRVEANGKEGSKKLEARWSYERDGEAIIPEFEATYTSRKRQVLWNAEHTVAIALTFTPTKFEREKDKSRDDKDKIEPDEGDDPLR